MKMVRFFTKVFKGQSDNRWDWVYVIAFIVSFCGIAYSGRFLVALIPEIWAGILAALVLSAPFLVINAYRKTIKKIKLDDKQQEKYYQILVEYRKNLEGKIDLYLYIMAFAFLFFLLSYRDFIPKVLHLNRGEYYTYETGIGTPDYKHIIHFQSSNPLINFIGDYSVWIFIMLSIIGFIFIIRYTHLRIKQLKQEEDKYYINDAKKRGFLT
jgi:hypothetical protein